jgi:hypothetical protein
MLLLLIAQPLQTKDAIMTNPTQVILACLPEAEAAVAQSKSVKAAFLLLESQGSAIAKAMNQTTFSQYYPRVMTVVSRTRHECVAIQSALDDSLLTLGAALEGYDAALLTIKEQAATIANMIAITSNQSAATENNDLLIAVFEGYEASLANNACNQGVNTGESNLQSIASNNETTVAITSNHNEIKGETMITRDEITAMIRSEVRTILDRRPGQVKRIKVPPPIQEGIPRNLDGWTVSYTNGWYKLSRRVNGKMYGLHIGKEWDANKALAKIADWNTKQQRGDL